jgi:hypothetical protein
MSTGTTVQTTSIKALCEVLDGIGLLRWLKRTMQTARSAITSRTITVMIASRNQWKLRTCSMMTVAAGWKFISHECACCAEAAPAAHAARAKLKPAGTGRRNSDGMRLMLLDPAAGFERLRDPGRRGGWGRRERPGM